MCLAVPLKLIRIDTTTMTGTVELSGGTLEVGIDLIPEACPGDYVLIHAGMAIERLETDDARSILETYRDYVYHGDDLVPGGHSESGNESH